jgi:hypothetical protein
VVPRFVAQTIDLIDTTAADCTLSDQHDAIADGAAKFATAPDGTSQPRMSNTKRPIVDSRDDTDTSIGLMLNECGPRWVFDAAVALQPREKGNKDPY